MTLSAATTTSSKPQDSKVAEEIDGYNPTPDADKKKAAAFFEHARSRGGTGNYDNAIEFYMNGLNLDPEAVDAHQELRELSLKRKVSGGKDLGMFEKMKLKGMLAKSKDPKEQMLTSERMLAHDPGNTDLMLGVMQGGFKGGYYDTVLWVGPLLMKAIDDSGKPDFNKFIAMRDMYHRLKQYKLAVDACARAAEMRPDDMDLQKALKDLGAERTMHESYAKATSFKDSIRDMDGQRKLLDADKEVHTVDVMTRIIADAEAAYAAEPNEPGKLQKLVDALVKTENPEHENRAIELLDQWHQKTKAFKYRLAVGQIQIRQLDRQERSLKQQAAANPTDADIQQQYKEFHQTKVEHELSEYQLWAENYPTESKFKFEAAKRLFHLGRFDEAIPAFQQVRNDPKYRTDAGIALGQAFLEAQFVDEAIDTLRQLIEEYQIRGDDRSRLMYYWYARALESKEDNAGAIKAYSQVAQWDFNYKDTQVRIRKLRSAGK